MVASPSLLMTSYLRERGVVGVRDIFENFTPPEISRQRLQLETANFVYELAMWSISLVMTDYPPNGRGQVTWPVSAFLAQAIFLEWMKLDISNLVCRLNVKCTKSKEFCSLGVHSESRDLLKFSEISANISETVQHRDIVTHAHTHTHTRLTALFPGLPRSAGTRKAKPYLDFTAARDSEWQWHQLGHMQVCISLQTDSHASTTPLKFLQAGCPSCRPKEI